VDKPLVLQPVLEELVEANEMKLALMRGVSERESSVFWVISETRVPCSRLVQLDVGEGRDRADLAQIGVDAGWLSGS
jgi:hypothetical protein